MLESGQDDEGAIAETMAQEVDEAVAFVDGWINKTGFATGQENRQRQ
jgi:hypothetical protein